jgi:hypothetical protein
MIHKTQVFKNQTPNIHKQYQLIQSSLGYATHPLYYENQNILQIKTPEKSHKQTTDRGHAPSVMLQKGRLKET